MTSLERFRCRRRPPCVGLGEPGVASPEPLSLCICWALGRSVRINLGFFSPKKQKKRERERRSIQVRTCGSVEISSSSQSNVSGGRGTRRTQAAPLEETRPGREEGCGLRGFAAGGEKAPQLYAFVKRDTREKAPNKEALGPLNYTAFLFCP
jgi:hypothetical protein